jgi:hypothetical protein
MKEFRKTLNLRKGEEYKGILKEDVKVFTFQRTFSEKEGRALYSDKVP